MVARLWPSVALFCLLTYVVKTDARTRLMEDGPRSVNPSQREEHSAQLANAHVSEDEALNSPGNTYLQRNYKLSKRVRFVRQVSPEKLATSEFIQTACIPNNTHVLRINCPDSKVSIVTTVIYGKTKALRPDFCKHATPIPEDCTCVNPHSAARIFKRCDGMQGCSFPVSAEDIKQGLMDKPCFDDSSYTGHIYVHFQGKCIPDVRADGGVLPRVELRQMDCLMDVAYHTVHLMTPYFGIYHVEKKAHQCNIWFKPQEPDVQPGDYSFAFDSVFDTDGDAACAFQVFIINKLGSDERTHKYCTDSESFTTEGLVGEHRNDGHLIIVVNPNSQSINKLRLWLTVHVYKNGTEESMPGSLQLACQATQRKGTQPSLNSTTTPTQKHKEGQPSVNSTTTPTQKHKEGQPSVNSTTTPTQKHKEDLDVCTSQIVHTECLDDHTLHVACQANDGSQQYLKFDKVHFYKAAAKDPHLCDAPMIVSPHEHNCVMENVTHVNNKFRSCDAQAECELSFDSAFAEINSAELQCWLENKGDIFFTVWFTCYKWQKADGRPIHTVDLISGVHTVSHPFLHLMTPGYGGHEHIAALSCTLEFIHSDGSSVQDYYMDIWLHDFHSTYGLCTYKLNVTNMLGNDHSEQILCDGQSSLSMDRLIDGQHRNGSVQINLLHTDKEAESAVRLWMTVDVFTTGVRTYAKGSMTVNCLSEPSKPIISSSIVHTFATRKVATYAPTTHEVSHDEEADEHPPHSLTLEDGSEPGFVDKIMENPMYLYVGCALGGTGLVVTIINVGFILYRKRRDKADSTTKSPQK